MKTVNIFIAAFLYLSMNLLICTAAQGQQTSGAGQFVFAKAGESSYFPLITKGKPVNILTDVIKNR